LGSSGLITGAFSSDTTLPTPVPINKGGTGQTTAQAAIDALTAVSGASTNEVLTKDGSGNAAWAAASGGATTELDNLGTTAVNATIDMNTNNLTNTQFLGCKIFAEQTISSNAITFTQSLTSIDCEADAETDDLDNWNGLSDGFFMLVKSVNNARDPTLRNGISGGNKANLAGAFTLADYDYRCFLSTWIQNNFAVQEISRSENSS